jgi:hypothetical protein
MNTCYSGGCVGADAIFGEYATKEGHEVKHFSFLNHKYAKGVPNNQIVVLDEFMLHQANSPLTNAAKVLKRNFPTRSHYTDCLLRRNYYQIRDSDKIYAVSYLDENGLVKGGTGWAVTMGILKDIKEVYLFLQDENKWVILNSYIPKDNKMYWDDCNPPKPSGSYAGIGSHDITTNGKEAIKNLYLSTT